MLKLKEDPRKNHVREMAIHFDAVLDESNDASTITMDNAKAKGFISSYKVFEGLTVWVYNITFLSDFNVDLDLSEDSPYYFSYNVKGHFLHRFGDKEDFSKILQNQNMLVTGGVNSSAQIIFPANVELKSAVIIVDVKLLENLEIRNAKRIFKKIGKIFNELPLQRPYRHIGRIDSEMEKYASVVCENKNIGLIGGLLTEGAVLNLFASQIQAFSEDIAGVSSQSNLSKAELSKITSLGAYITQHFKTSITIRDLSKYFGISPKKLQLGVKYLYGDTVGHYISNIRMSHAKHLLVNTDLNVTEVCYAVGISSTSYFSKVFKNRYGNLPSYYK